VALPPGVERAALMKKLEQTEQAVRISEWLNSPDPKADQSLNKGPIEVDHRPMIRHRADREATASRASPQGHAMARCWRRTIFAVLQNTQIPEN
jgi:hypothetical protein